MTATYSYNSYKDYAKAYGHGGAADYLQARNSYDSSGTGHHPGLCSDRCTSCTTPSTEDAMAASIETTNWDLDLSDEEFDLIDKIEAAMTAAPADKSWTPSEMARKVKSETARVRDLLDWMVRHQDIASCGNGAWTRYTCLAWRRNCG